jgi:hypothetical protein
MKYTPFSNPKSILYRKKTIFAPIGLVVLIGTVIGLVALAIYCVMV